MIAFVVAVADQDRYETIAAPAIERVREPDSVVLAVAGEAAPQLALNRALDELAGVPDLEAAVIVHEDVELLDLDTGPIVRRAFADPAVALVGVVGGRGVTGLAWWAATAIGHAETPHVRGGAVGGVAARGEVDALDGIVLCLSPWAVRTLRFDAALAADFHGYDIDLCFQARHHGRRVEVVELRARHVHRPLLAAPDRWSRNELRFQRRWFDHRMISALRHQALARSLSSDTSPSRARSSARSRSSAA